MSRTLFFPLIALCLFLCTATAQAQRAVVNSEKAKGTFQISDQGPAAIDVNFKLTPAYPDNLTIYFQSKSPFTLNAHVVNAKGQEMLSIDQAQVTGRYASSLSVASLQPGSYYLEVSNSATAGSTFRVPFEIAKQSIK
jgi:hypothetical protein